MVMIICLVATGLVGIEMMLIYKEVQQNILSVKKAIIEVDSIERATYM